MHYLYLSVCRKYARTAKKIIVSVLIFFSIFSNFFLSLSTVQAQVDSQTARDSSTSVDTPLQQSTQITQDIKDTKLPTLNITPSDSLTSEDQKSSSVDQSKSQDSSQAVDTDTTKSSTDKTPSSDVASPKSSNVQTLSASVVSPSDSLNTDNSAYVLNPTSHLTPDTTNGSLNYSYPLSIPPGRGQMTPTIELVYNNQTGEDISPYGYGWTDNIPYIQIENKTGSENLYATSSTYFYSSLSGELASTSASSYISKTDNGDFLKYTFSNNTWVATDKQGIQYIFGTTTASRLDYATTTTEIYKWMLQKEIDTNGNFITYSYYKDDGQIYPSSITYTNDATSTGLYEVDFLRTLRSDIATSSKAAFNIVDNYLISEIDIKTNGTLYHKYILGYTAGNNGRRSLLRSITETAYDESLNSTTLPATAFSYATSTIGFTDNSNLYPPLPFTDIGGAQWDHGVRYADLNGDGLPDIFKSYTEWGSTTTTTYNLNYINTGNGYTASSTWDLPTTIVTQDYLGNHVDAGVRFVDINGDGLTDVLQATDNNGATNYNAYLNNGNGFTASSTWNSPVAFIGYNGAWFDNGVRFTDINGDGLVDILQAIDFNNGTSVRHAYINTGHGFVDEPQWDSPWGFAWQDGADNVNDRAILEDVNGDGLPDILVDVDYSDGSNAVDKTYINNGHGFTEDPEWRSPIAFQVFPDSSNDLPFDNGVRFMDINGDGLPDIVRSLYYGDTNITNQSVYINTGNGFVQNNSWTIPVAIAELHTDSPDNGIRIMDINGDGADDFVQSLSYEGSPSFWNQHAYIDNTSKTDLLTGINLSKGGSMNIAYQATPMYQTGTGSTTPASPHLPLVLQTVKSITNNNGLGGIGTTTYSYSGGTYYYNNPFDKKFAGFQTITSTDPVGNITKTYYHTSNGSDSAHGEYQDNIAKIGKAYRIEKYDNAGNLYEKTINKWDSATTSANAAFVKLTQTVDSTYDGTVNHKDKAEQYTYDNTTGNQTQKIQWGQVNGSDDGSFTDTGTDDFTTNISYASSTNLNIIDLPSDETTTDHSLAKVSETRHYYDNLALGNIGVGNETKTEKWKTGSTYSNVQKIYNSYGLVTQDIDPRGKQTNYTYDQYNLSVATSTNPLSQPTSYVYNYSIGKVKQITDPNKLITQIVYDGFGRIEQQNQPDITTPSTLVTKTSYSYNDTFPTLVHESDYLNSATTTDTYNYYDGFNRLIQQRKSAESPASTNVFSVKDQTYNTRGLLASESQPYFSYGSSTTPASPISAYYTNYNYDPLQRLTASATVIGTTSTSYNNWKTTITDPRGKTKDLYNDAFGNLIQVDEHNATSTYSTYYAYDGLKDLIKITDANGNVRNFTYDGLGRQLTAEDLHAVGDTSFGTWNYTYDDANNLTQQVDPKSQTVNYTYDDINRPLTEDYTGLAGTEVSYSYDSCTNGIGKLCSATSTGAVTTYQYDPLGLEKQETKTINGTSYITQFTHDRQGNNTLITYPDNSQVQYIYNVAGLTDQVLRKENGDSTFTPVVLNFDYAPTGQISYEHDNNGTETFYTYDPLQLYRLVNKTTVGPSSESGSGFHSLALMQSPLSSTTTETNNLKPQSNGSKLYTTPVELPQKQTTKSETHLLGYAKNGNPIFQTTIHAGDNSYFNSQTKSLQSIDSTLQDGGNAWHIGNAPFQVGISKIFSPDFMTFTNQGQNLSFSTASSSITSSRGYEITGTSTKQYREIIYPGALGTGLDIIVDTSNHAVTKDVRIDTLQSLGDLKKLQNYTFNFRLTANRPIDIKVGNQLLSKEKTITTTGEAQIIDSQGVSSYIWPPQAYDSSVLVSPNHSVNISITYTLQSDGSILITKSIPISWLKTATYPVYADATISYYPAAGDGTITTGPYPSSWSTQHADTTGHGFNYTDTNIYAETEEYNSSTGYLDINRAFIPFDTTSLPSTASTTSATVNIYTNTKYDDFNDSNGTVNIYHSSQASVTSLQNSDISTCGAVTNPTKGSSDKDITTISTGTYTSFTLNSTGLGWIVPAGYTKLCIREGHDASNTNPNNSGNIWEHEAVIFNSSESTGTSTDPYLQITYTMPNSAPATSTALETEDQINPTGLTTITPHFSAIYNDPDSGDLASAYEIQVSASSTVWATSTLMWDTGQTTLTASTTQGTRSPEIAYAGQPLILNGSTYYWRIKFWDIGGLSGPWSAGTDNFTLANPAPSTNYANCSTAQFGTSTPAIECNTPLFSTLRPLNTSTSSLYWLQVSTTSDFSSTLWDTGSSGTSLQSLPAGNRTPDIVYKGPALNFATSTYYWRIKLWNGGYSGDWSTTNNFSTVNKNFLQNISYSYDADGNIINITDLSSTTAAKTVNYTYDDLNRLLAASTTAVANGTNYNETFTYNPIGNITSTSDGGLYTYGGNIGTNYANPHAVTAIASTTLTYDNNGNMLTGPSISNTWDYKNRLTQSVIGSTTITYGYDQDGNRVKYSNGSQTTYYPNQYYNISSATTTKQIYANGQLIATLLGSGSTTVPTYVFTDQLSGSNAITDTNGNLIESVDYYPYGKIRVDQGTGVINEEKKFTGYEYDQDTGLNYAQARYQNPSIGRFISEDSSFLDIGDSAKLKQDTNQDLQVYLSDPQQLNSYSYTRNNPIVKTDPTGKALGWDDGLLFAAYLLFAPRQLSADPVYESQLYAAQNSPITKVIGSFSEGGLNIQGGLMGGIESRLEQSALQSEGSMVCRGGSCGTQNFINGSNEFKNGLKPTADTPLTGISVNIGNDKSKLLQSSSLVNYGQYGQTTQQVIKQLGGTIELQPTKTNPYHANINGLNANQLNSIFTPTQKNPFKLK